MYWKILLLWLVLLLLLLPVQVPWRREPGLQRRQQRSGSEAVPRGGVQRRPPSLDQMPIGRRRLCHIHCRHYHGCRSDQAINTWYPPPSGTPTRPLCRRQRYRLRSPRPFLQNVFVLIAVIVDGDKIQVWDNYYNSIDDNNRVYDIIFYNNSLKL